MWGGGGGGRGGGGGGEREGGDKTEKEGEDITCYIMRCNDFRMATLLAQQKFEEAEVFANKFNLDLEVQS